MGTDYANTDELARKARAALRKIQVLYPALKLGPLRGGIRVEPDNLPAITPRPAAAVEHVAPAQKEAPVTLDRDRLRALKRTLRPVVYPEERPAAASDPDRLQRIQGFLRASVG